MPCTDAAPSARRCCTRSTLLELDGEDLRGLPLGDRKKRLARLLGKRRIGIVLSEHTDEDGALIFRQACKLGLEGIVSKRLSAPYRSGPSRDWVKIKNPNSPAMIRAREAEW
jgi:ATP-dependent DNA ligase